MRQCQTSILEYKYQLKKVFNDCSVLGQKTASISILQNNTITSHDTFNPQLANSTAKPDVKNKTQDNSYLDCIDKKFEPLSEREEFVEIIKNRPQTKKAKIHHNISPSSKDPHQSTDNTLSKLIKNTKKNNTGLKLTNQIKEWCKHCEKPFE